MKHSWRIGKIFGIDIYIDSSWFVIFIIVTVVLATGYFPRQYSEWSTNLYWMIGVLTSLFVFVSVLIHELAHSLVALQHGEKVRSITLFILGGVAQITEEPKEPLREFVMAVAGPLTSFALGTVFLVLSFFLRAVSQPLGASTFYLGLINFVLGVFNLLPGFPMDGGRVLRSIVWRITNDLRKATRIASLSGQAFAFFFIFIGVFQFLRGDFSGLWFVFIGWFLHSTAVRGYNQVMVASMLKGVRAEDIMTRDFESVPGSLEVQELVDEYILKKKERVFLVTDNGALKGIVCLEDVKALSREKWKDTTVEAIMTPKEKLHSVSIDADGSKVLSSLTGKDIHQIPVMDGERVAGIICRSDVLRYIQLRSDLNV